MSGFGVCMISTHYYPHIGGAERQIERLSTWLVDKGTPVMIVTRAIKGNPSYEVRDGVVIFRVPVLKGKIPGALSFIIMALWTMLRERKRYDVIHSHQIFSPTTIGWLAWFFLRKPLVVNLHRGGQQGDIDKLLRNPRVGRMRLNRLRKDAAAFIGISTEIMNELKANGVAEHKIYFLPNAVDPNHFKPADHSTQQALRQRLSLAAEAPLVVYVGRLVPEKGLDVLLDAWKDVPEPAQLLIVGTGPLDGHIRQRVSSELAGRVHVLGPKDNVVDYLQASDGWVLPSFTEGLPLSLLEGMACGLPIVATRVGGVPDVINHDKTGILVNSGDAAMLALALSRVVARSAEVQAMGQAARASVLEKYSTDPVAQGYYKLYQDVLKS